MARWVLPNYAVLQLPDNNLLPNPHEVVRGAVLVFCPFKPQSLKCQVYDNLLDSRLLWVKMVNKGENQFVIGPHTFPSRCMAKCGRTCTRGERLRRVSARGRFFHFRGYGESYGPVTQWRLEVLESLLATKEGGHQRNCMRLPSDDLNVVDPI